MTVKEMEQVVQKVFEMDDNDLLKVDITNPFRDPKPGTIELAIAEAAYLESRLRWWVGAPPGSRFESICADWWKTIASFEDNSPLNRFRACALCAWAPVIGRLFRERAMQAGWRPPQIPPRALRGGEREAVCR